MATATMPPQVESNKPEASPMQAAAPTQALSLHRISYERYDKMVNLGIFGPNDKVVLLDGLLVNRMTRGAQHRNCVLRGLKILQVAAPAGWEIYPEQPVALRNGLDGDSAPEPDLMVVFGSLERYEDRHPTGSEIGMVIEVAATADAVRIDRAWIGRFAHAGIPVACIVNFLDRSIEVHTEPSGPSENPGYAKLETLRPGQVLVASIGNAITGPAATAPIPIESFFPPV